MRLTIPGLAVVTVLFLIGMLQGCVSTGDAEVDSAAANLGIQAAIQASEREEAAAEERKQQARRRRLLEAQHRGQGDGGGGGGH